MYIPAHRQGFLLLPGLEPAMVAQEAIAQAPAVSPVVVAAVHLPLGLVVQEYPKQCWKPAAAAVVQVVVLRLERMAVRVMSLPAVRVQVEPLQAGAEHKLPEAQRVQGSLLVRVQPEHKLQVVMEKMA